jgi:hypothetical protein
MRIRSLLVLSALTLTLSVSASAQEAPHAQILRFVDSGSRPGPADRPDILAERTVRVDPAALTGSPRLALLDGRVYATERTDLEMRGPRDWTWRGRVLDPDTGEEAGTATLTVQGDLVMGDAYLLDGIYRIEPRIEPAAHGEHRLARIDHRLLGGCAGDPAPALGRDGRRPVAMSRAGAALAPPVPVADGGSVSRIDLLVVWSPAAQQGAGGAQQIRLFVQNAVDQVNTTYINSQVDARVNLVGTQQIPFTETGDPETDLDALQRDRNMASLRKSLGADVVSMVVNQMLGACGIGYLMAKGDMSADFAPYAVNTVKRACGGLVMAHEIGHNLGCEHDVQNSNPAAALFPYAFGHIVEGSFRTVMSYNNNCTICPEIPNFSNPDVVVDGAPTGIPDQRDNHRVINQTRGVVSSFFPAQPCKAGADRLCLLNKRFQVQLVWQNQFNNTEGSGTAIPRTDAAGFFSFGDPSNVELMVKLLDFGNVVKLFYGELTNLHFSLIVTDTATGISKTYSNTAGDCGAIDQSAFSASSSFLASSVGPRASGGCKAGKNTLCLEGNRFQVTVDWHNPGNNTGGAGSAVSLSQVTGAFWFTDASNLELMTKIIDYGDRIDFFYGTLTDLEYTITVTDTRTGQVKTYHNPAGHYCGGLDGSAFPH